MFPILAVALLSPAAPVPKPTGVALIEQAFGTFSDPEKACAAKLANGTLTLTLKAETAPGVGGKREKLPTFTREVAGDFTAVVRVRCDLPKGAEPVAQKWAETGGGIVFVRDDGRVFCVGLHDFEYRGERMRMIPNPLGHGPVGRRTPADDDARFVRVRRTGATMALESSRDGKEWETDETYKNFSDKPMRVGVYATHNLNVGSTVRLDQFALTEPDGKK